MSTFIIDYKIVNKKDSSYAGVFGSQLKSPLGELLDVVLLINLNADKSEDDLSKITKFVSEDLLSYITSKINDEVSYLDILDTIQSRLEYIVSNVIDKGQGLKEQGVDINLMVSLRENLFYYILLFGEIQAQIKRDDSVVSISDILSESGNSRSQFKTGSLQLKHTDRLVIAFLKSTEELSVKGIATNSIETLSIDNVLSEYKSRLEDSCLVVLLMANEQDLWPIDQAIADEYHQLDQDKSTDTQEDQDYNNKEYDSSMDELDLADADEEHKLADKLKILLTKIKALSLNVKEKLAQYVQNLRSRSNEDTEHKEFDSEGEEGYENEEKFDEIEDDITQDRTPIASKISSFITRGKDRLDIVARKSSQSDFLQQVKLTLSKFIKLVKDSFVKYIIGTDDFDRRNVRKKKNNLMRNRVILVVVVLMLFIFINNSIQEAEVERQRVETLNTANNQLNSLTHRFQSIRNQFIQSQSVSSQTRSAIISELNSVKSELQRNSNVKNLFANEYNALDSQIANFIDQVNQVVAVTNPTIVSDINVFFSDARVSSATLAGNDLFVSDSNRGVVYRLPTSGSGITPQVFVTGLVQPFLLVADTENNVIFYDNDANSGVGRFSSTQENVLTRFQGLSPANIGRPITASIFSGNGAIYEIIPINKQIFRRDRQGNSFAGGGAVPTNDSSNWITDNRLVNSIQIKTPYSIYVLAKGEGIMRFLAGADTNLTFEKYQGLTNEDFQLMRNATAFDVSEKYMAVAVPERSRIMIFEKVGDEINFQGYKFIKSLEYRGTQNLFKNISELFLIENENKIIMLDGSKVIQVNIN